MTPEECERIEAMLREGVSYARIESETGRSRWKISRIAKAARLLRDNSRTIAATERKHATAAEKRARLENDFLDDAERLRKQLWEPCTIHNFGGKDNTHNSIDLDRPLFSDQLSIVRAASAAAQKSLDLARYQSEAAGGEHSKAMIERLADGLRNLAADTVPPGEGVA